MEKRRRVAISDNSLYMAGIITSLRADPTLEVLCVHPDSPADSLWPDENNLAAVIFDLTEPSLKLDIAALRNHPGLLLIGVDPSKDEILVLSSRPVQALSMADLVDVIQQKESTSSAF